MDELVKQRLVGAAVLSLMAAIALPWLFGNPKDPRDSIQARFAGTPVPMRPAIAAEPVSTPVVEVSRGAPVPDLAVISAPSVAATRAPATTSVANWILQLASYREEAAADDFLSKLRKDGYAAYRERVSVNGTNYYRVRLKLGGERDSAVAVQQGLEKTYRLQAQLFSAR